MRRKVWELAFALFLSTAVVAAVPGFKQKVYADEGIAINETNFPDAEFRDYIKNGIGSGTRIDQDGDDVLSPEEISNATEIDVQQMGVHDLKGIEYFTSLTRLNCDSNTITRLDLSQNTDLIYLSCANNQLTSLDVSNNLDLKNIKCSSNQLTSLDVSQNTALKTFQCYDNQLTNLDVSQNTALEHFRCYDNKLTTLIVGQKPVLGYLNCSQNNLTNLDVSQCPVLRELNCMNNQLTSLDVSRNTNLTTLYCDGNQLTNLDVSRNTLLMELSCQSNQLSNLDVRQNPALKGLFCSENNLQSLDLSKNPSIMLLVCSRNKLTSLDVSGKTNLWHLICDENQITSLDVSRSRGLTLLVCNNNSLISLDLSQNHYFGDHEEIDPSYSSQSRRVHAAYSSGKLVVDLVNDLGLDTSRVFDVAVTGGTYSDGKAYFDLPVASEAKITYNYDTKNTLNNTMMDVTLTLAGGTVTFETNGGSTIESQTLEAGSKAIKPADPTKDGYHFVNWYIDPAFTNGSEYDFDMPVTQDITLYAKWEKDQQPVRIAVPDTGVSVGIYTFRKS